MRKGRKRGRRMKVRKASWRSNEMINATFAGWEVRGRQHENNKRPLELVFH